MALGARVALAVATAATAAIACDGRVTDASVGEVLVWVDTDLPVPDFVSRLRVDLYDSDAVWYASRDVSLARPSDWPTSFGVSAPDEVERVVTIRLRAYPEGGVRDYRGERFAPRPPRTNDAAALVEAPQPPANDQPRLSDESGADVTPALEPQPLLAIDRLVKVRVAAHRRSAVRVVLTNVCVGTMADVKGGMTCVDREDVRLPAVELATEPTSAAPPKESGSFTFTTSCAATPRAPTITTDGTPLHDDEVCVGGAVTQLGSSDGVFGSPAALPQRIAIVDAFLVDRWELSVARYRSALADGFVSPDGTPTANEGDIPTTFTDYLAPEMCTFSATPRGRETEPLNCISWAAARALCRFFGGDLPSEAEWEYLATAAHRDHRTRFPWGGDDDTAPTCARAVWGRGESRFSGQLCTNDGFGFLPVDARAGEGGDVAPGTGVVGLGGNLAEWQRDALAPFTAACWMSSSLRAPECAVDTATMRSIRGGSYRDNLAGLVASNRRGQARQTGGIGLRCVRR